MKFEHFALNVPDPRALAAWYVRHAGWQIARAQLEAPFKHFLADEPAFDAVCRHGPKTTESLRGLNLQHMDF